MKSLTKGFHFLQDLTESGRSSHESIAERQQAQSTNMWTVVTAGEEFKQGSQETCNETWAASGVHKGSWKGSKQGGDTFADDTNANHTAGIKANYTLLQEDLTVLEAGSKDGTRNAALVQTQGSECAHTHSKSA